MSFLFRSQDSISRAISGWQYEYDKASQNFYNPNNNQAHQQHCFSRVVENQSSSGHDLVRLNKEALQLGHASVLSST